MSWCLADVIEVHGDPGFRGNASDPWSSGTPVIYPHVDPTAESVLMQEGVERIDVPEVTEGMVPHSAEPGQEPFILPPEKRTEGKPFILPPNQRRPNKPFILPPAEREPGKPFVESPRESRRQPPRVPGEIIEQANTWKPPKFFAPWRRRADRAESTEETPPQPHYGATSPAARPAPSQPGVVPVEYRTKPGSTINNNYPPPPFPTAPH